MFFIISFLIIIHEIGHATAGIFLGIKLKRIVIYPLGGITKFEMPQNTLIIKEFIILIMGPIFQMIAFLTLKKIYINDLKLISFYHTSILLFNLLPIYPLDGGKLLSLLFQIIIPLKISLYISIIISYILLFIIFIISPHKINSIIMIIFLLFKITQEEKRIEYIYHKFLLERYLYNYKFKKNKIINNINNLFRDKNHIIRENNKYYYEKEYLYEKLIK